MNDDSRFPVVLLWHMHQPEYRAGGHFQLPWTYLHALKDYTDMASHLEAVPEARAVVNFAPVLLEQLEDYTLRFDRHAQSGTPFDDFMLDALATLPACGPARARVVRMALRADSARQVEHVPAYRALAERLRAGDDAQAGAGQIGDGDLTDLLIGWHLAWTAPSVLADDAEAAALHARQGGFAPADRAALLRVIGRHQQLLRMDFEKALVRLPDGARQVFVLFDVEGYRHEEIGEMLGIPEGTARSDRLNLDTYLELETVSDPQLSPDGSQILYTRGWIDKMNDQHAYLRLPEEADMRVADLRVGDLVGCGISHPCTTFDKWAVLLLVDDDYNVQRAINTLF